VETRIFLDESGKEWKVTKTKPGHFTIDSPMRLGQKRYEIARSCAFKLGVTQTANGDPVEHVNEHVRIWAVIWDKGRPV